MDAVRLKRYLRVCNKPDFTARRATSQCIGTCADGGWHPAATLRGVTPVPKTGPSGGTGFWSPSGPGRCIMCRVALQQWAEHLRILFQMTVTRSRCFVRGAFPRLGFAPARSWVYFSYRKVRPVIMDFSMSDFQTIRLKNLKSRAGVNAKQVLLSNGKG